MITVSKLQSLPRLFSEQTAGEPLLTLTGHDQAMVAKRGGVHEVVMGFDYATGEYMSRQEHIVTLNPRELPA